MREKILLIIGKAAEQGYVDEEMKDAMRREAFEREPDFFMLEAGLALVEVFKESMEFGVEDLRRGRVDEVRQ